ncbi:MAG: Nramp family divalent metal transporter [Acidobacteriaceae bacterium]
MATIPPVPTLSDQRPRFRWLPELRSGQLWSYFGPAFVASIAYIDPGNFITNIQGGSQFGYQLLWVLLWSNLMAILVQYLSAKLGIATGRTLPQNCRDHFSRRTTIGLWIAAEVSAVATDMTEFLGAALGFYLLFGQRWMAAGWSKTSVLMAAAVLAAICVFAILALELYGFRKLEVVIMGFVFIIGICYAFELFLLHINWKAAAFYTLVPVVDHNSIYIAVAILGATVMPHVVYLHSGLVQPRVRQSIEREEQEELASPGGHRRHHHRFRLLQFELVDVFAAMNGAWLINSAMLIVAAAAFAHLGRPVDSVEDAHHTLGPLLGPFSAMVFAVALLCSGLSSSTVGTMAGQMIIEGFMEVKFSVFLRRLITLAPALAVIAVGLSPLKIIIFSQVMLSFTLPFALVPLLILTGRRGLMQQFVNRRLTAWLGWLTVAVILALNGLLIVQQML